MVLVLLLACGGATVDAAKERAAEERIAARAAEIVLARLAETGAAVEGAPAEVAGGEGVDVDLGPDDPPRYRVPVGPEQPSRGPADAPVTIVVFSDFQCPFCRRVVPTIERIMTDYSGRVRFVWRDQPLPFHDLAEPAALYAREALRTGGVERFWEAHDELFERIAEDPAGAEVAIAAANRAIPPAIAAAHDAAIEADVELAERVGARGTPTFFINGRRLAGAQPFQDFKEIIDEELALADRLAREGVPRSALYATLMRSASNDAPDEEPVRPSAPERDPTVIHRIDLGNEPTRGPADALVTMIMFSDFECPFCARVEPTVSALLERYGNDLRVVWMNNPLHFHPRAFPAAMLALEAFEQGGSEKFWRVHELLFAQQRSLLDADLLAIARTARLRIPEVRRAIDTSEHAQIIERHQAITRALDAEGTPSFFINGRSVRGAQPIEAFVRVIDEELVRARTLVAGGTPRAGVYAAAVAAGVTRVDR